MMMTFEEALLVLILTVVDDYPVGMFLDPLLVHLNDA